jgi:threonine/homoserine/homoserine lactone efflux protein
LRGPPICLIVLPISFAGDQRMTVIQSLLLFSLAAGLLTITPGLDTTLVLRTSASEGAKPAALAAIGIGLG